MFFAHVKLRNNNWHVTNYSSKNIMYGMVPAIFSRRAFEPPCYDESLNSFAGREGQTPLFEGRAHAAPALAKNTLLPDMTWGAKRVLRSVFFWFNIWIFCGVLLIGSLATNW